MRISRLQVALSYLREKHGDVEVHLAIKQNNDVYRAHEIDDIEIDKIPRVGDPLYIALIKSK